MARLRGALTRHSLQLPTSELERRFLPIAARAGLPPPQTHDGLRYQRTAEQQGRDARRDQAHALAGLERLRFTHHQVARETPFVERTLRGVAKRRSDILDT